MLETVARWARKGQNNNKREAQSMEANDDRSRAVFDDLTAQLHRAEQNLHVEVAARKWSEQQSEHLMEDAKSSARLAAEQAAVFQEQQSALQADLDAATEELSRLQQEQSSAVASSPTDSEQLVKAVRRAKQQRMQSQDCVRIMASSAAAAEARARQLQEALTAAEKDLHEARLKLIDLEMANKKQEQAIAESAGLICRLQDEAAAAGEQRRDYQHKVDLLHRQLETSQNSIRKLEACLRQAERTGNLSMTKRSFSQPNFSRPTQEGLPPANGHRHSGGWASEYRMQHQNYNLQLVLHQSDAQALTPPQPSARFQNNLALAQDFSAFLRLEARLENPSCFSSLPSPLYCTLPDLDASVGNLSSPAALFPRPAKPSNPEWTAPAPPTKSQQSAGTVYPSQKSNQENSPPRAGLRSSSSPAEAKQQAMDKCARLTAWVDSTGKDEKDADRSCEGIKPFDGSEGVTNKPVIAHQVIQAPIPLTFRSSDYGPLGSGQYKLQPVQTLLDESSRRQPQIRQPLSPVNARLKNRLLHKSPFQKSSPPSAQPSTASHYSPTTSQEPQQHLPMHWHQLPLEDCGPLCMGVRGIDEDSAPPKERATKAMHKGWLKLAHKVPPLRKAAFGGLPHY